jgi:hypothetical protein
MRIQGIKFEVDWTKFKPGRTFFLPCLDINAAKTEVKTVCNRLKFKVEMRGVIENGIRGLRVWRIR